MFHFAKIHPQNLIFPEANTLIAGSVSHFTFLDGVFTPYFNGIFS
jgi:hypothetical protein